MVIKGRLGVNLFLSDSTDLDGIECNQVTKEDRLELSKPFDLEEIKEVVFELKDNKAIGVDGLPAGFYQTF
jgi:hypothetical protein